MKQGDILKYKSSGSSMKILGICGEMYFLSLGNDHEIFWELMTKKQIEQYFEIPKKRWKPEEGVRYYSISGEGDIFYYIWNDSSRDIQGYEMGNVFRTKEEAEAAPMYGKIPNS